MKENRAKEYLEHMLWCMGDETPGNLTDERDIKEWEDEHKNIRETFEIAIAALETQIPKKQCNINDYDSHLRLSKAGFLCCSATNKDIRYPFISLRDLEYCPRCGQKLDWE